MDISKETEVKVEPKKVWSNPELVAYGSIEDITNTQDKKLGSSDTFTFQGIPIMNAS